MNARYTLLIVAVFAAASTGCSIFDSGQNALVRTAKMFKPNPYDADMQPDTGVDDWEFVGKEGRADQKRERDPDPWWQNYMMSEEARNIERNLGID